MRTQLRAIFRAAKSASVSVMFPMIATLAEWRAARAMVDEERARLGVPAIPVGIMVETPAAALIADQFAREADFLSLGTNDLTQYTLAMDRTNPKLAPQVDALHPSVLRLIARTVEGGARARQMGGRVRRARGRSRCGAGAHRPRRDGAQRGSPAHSEREGARARAVDGAVQADRNRGARGRGWRGRARDRRAASRMSACMNSSKEREMNFIRAAFGWLQKIGKSLMLPVSVLPAAGILLGVGSAKFTCLPAVVSDVMAQAGGAIFGNLPLIFAIGVALGLTGNDGVAALAAVVGFAVMLATMGVMAPLLHYEPTTIMGIPVDRDGRVRRHPDRRRRRDSVQSLLPTRAPGVSRLLRRQAFGADPHGVRGDLRRHRVELRVAADRPQHRHVLALGRDRHPAIGVRALRRRRARADPVRPASHLERAVLLRGGHATSIRRPERSIHGEINRFVAGDPTAGNLAGGYLFKMWGLPAAALAIWRTAKPENRARIGGIMISAALTSFLTGITEPIEFAFLFVAPVLYAIHAVLAGAAYWVGHLSSVFITARRSRTGSSTSSCSTRTRTRGWWLVPLGLALGGMYYAIFRTLILKFDLKTPGRENPTTRCTTPRIAPPPAGAAASDSMAAKLVAAFGGAANIRSLDACITRLRLELFDNARANPDALRALGATGVMTVPGACRRSSARDPRI